MGEMLKKGEGTEVDMRDFVLESAKRMDEGRLDVICEVLQVKPSEGVVVSEGFARWLSCLESMYRVWHTPKRLSGRFKWDTPGEMARVMESILVEALVAREEERVRHVMVVLELSAFDLSEIDEDSIFCLILRCLREIRGVRLECLRAVKGFLRSYDSFAARVLVSSGISAVALMILRNSQHDLRLVNVIFEVLTRVCHVEEGHKRILIQSSELIDCLVKMDSLHYELESVYSFIKAFVCCEEFVFVGYSNWGIVARHGYFSLFVDVFVLSFC